MHYSAPPSGRIWLIGGTQESAQLAAAIAHTNLPCTISVTTESARSLYPVAANLQVWVGYLNSDRLQEFLQEQRVVAILDASHPYAVEISQIAIAAAHQWQIPYLRYERPNVQTGLPASPLMQLDSFDALITSDYLLSSRVLLTIGCKHLHLFRCWQERSTLFVRILPTAPALAAATAAGFTSDRIICLRPPISVDLEVALWRQWAISLVVTKASGTPGGEDIKRTVAAQLGVPLIVVDRPAISYPQQTSDLLDALDFCRQQYANV